jgi:hypothetical protein
VSVDALRVDDADGLNSELGSVRPHWRQTHSRSSQAGVVDLVHLVAAAYMGRQVLLVEERLEVHLVVYLVRIVVVAQDFELTADAYRFAGWLLMLLDLGSRIRCRQWLMKVVSRD